MQNSCWGIIYSGNKWRTSQHCKNRGMKIGISLLSVLQTTSEIVGIIFLSVIYRRKPRLKSFIFMRVRERHLHFQLRKQVQNLKWQLWYRAKILWQQGMTQASRLQSFPLKLLGSPAAWCQVRDLLSAQLARNKARCLTPKPMPPHPLLQTQLPPNCRKKEMWMRPSCVPHHQSWELVSAVLMPSDLPLQSTAHLSVIAFCFLLFFYLPPPFLSTTS